MNIVLFRTLFFVALQNFLLYSIREGFPTDEAVKRIFHVAISQLDALVWTVSIGCHLVGRVLITCPIEYSSLIMWMHIFSSVRFQRCPELFHCNALAMHWHASDKCIIVNSLHCLLMYWMPPGESRAAHVSN